jgi:hypothetical protein
MFTNQYNAIQHLLSASVLLRDLEPMLSKTLVFYAEALSFDLKGKVESIEPGELSSDSFPSFDGVEDNTVCSCHSYQDPSVELTEDEKIAGEKMLEKIIEITEKDLKGESLNV